MRLIQLYTYETLFFKDTFGRFRHVNNISQFRLPPCTDEINKGVDNFTLSYSSNLTWTWKVTA